jgi:hypothetical protein
MSMLSFAIPCYVCLPRKKDHFAILKKCFTGTRHLIEGM